MTQNTKGRSTVVILVMALVIALTPGSASADLLASDGGSTSVDVAASCSGRTGSQVTQPGPFDIGRTFVAELPSDVDGATIEVGVVRPATGDDHRSPVIAVASPYLLSDLKDVDLTSCDPFLVDNYVQHGYTIAFIPTRGAGDSDACPNLMGPKERADLDQAITWLGTQSWSNGKVGMIGISYDGSTPWGVASMGNPHLATIVPASGVHDLFDLVYYRARNDWRWWLFVPGYYHYYGHLLNTPLHGRQADRYAASATSCDDADVGMAATVESYETGEYDSYGYWAERNVDPDILDRYRGSVLLVQGLQDWNVDPDHQYPFINDLERRGVYVKHLLGQWDHTWPDGEVGGRSDFADMLLRWWERWLKDDRSVDTGPRVEVQDSALRWRTAKAWPPKKVRPSTLFLGADNTLHTEPDGGTATTTVGPSSRNRYFFVNDGSQAYNDLPIDRICATCATFTHPVEGDDLHLTGTPQLDLTVVPTGPSGHLSAFVFRVHGDERQLLGWGATDLRFPRGGYEAQPVVAGQQMRVALPLQPLDAVVPAGQELVIVIDQGHADHVPSRPMFPVELQHGGGNASFAFDEARTHPKEFFEPPLATYANEP